MIDCGLELSALLNFYPQYITSHELHSTNENPSKNQSKVFFFLKKSIYPLIHSIFFKKNKYKLFSLNLKIW